VNGLRYSAASFNDLLCVTDDIICSIEKVSPLSLLRSSKSAGLSVAMS